MASFVFFRVPFFIFSSFLLLRNQHDSQASFVSHHACVSFCRIYQRNGFDHRANLLMARTGWADRRVDQTGKVSAMAPEQEHGEG